VVVGLLGDKSPDSNRFTLVTPKSENDVRLQAKLGNQNPTGLPVGAVSCKDQPFDEIKKSITELSQKLSEDNTLSIANALCVNEMIRDSIREGFKEQLSKDYSSELFASKNIVDDVNEWVKKKP